MHKINLNQTQRLRRISSDPLLRYSIILVVVWRACLEILCQLVGHPTYPQTSFAQYLAPWANWDGGWYLSIINQGYAPPDDPTWTANVAFFPSFPTTTNFIADFLHISPLYVGLVLNIFLTIGCVYLLMKLAYLLANRYGLQKNAVRISLISAAVLLLHPAAFFMAAFYTEAFLIFGFIGAVYFALTSRYWLAVPFLIIASASKATGVLAIGIVGLIALEQWLRTHGSIMLMLKRWSVAILGTSGLAAYMAYLWIKHGDPLLFYKVESFWGRDHQGFFPAEIIRGYYAHIVDPAYFHSTFIYGMMLMYMMVPFVLIGAGIIIARAYRTFWPLVLGIAIVVIPLSTGLMESLNRYSLAAAPIIPFIVIWINSKVRPQFIYALLALSGFVMLVSAYGFLDGDYFAG